MGDVICATLETYIFYCRGQVVLWLKENGKKGEVAKRAVRAKYTNANYPSRRISEEEWQGLVANYQAHFSDRTAATSKESRREKKRKRKPATPTKTR